MPSQNISNASLDKYTMNSGCLNEVMNTPEKRQSSSRRKTATPKKKVVPAPNIQGSFIQTLTENINSKVPQLLFNK